MLQEHALELLPAQLGGMTAEGSGSNLLLPRLLAAASSPHRPTRQLAVTCLAAAASATQVAKLCSHAGMDTAALNHLLAGLLQHEREIVDDEQGLVQVVRQLLSADNPDDQEYRYFSHHHISWSSTFITCAWPSLLASNHKLCSLLCTAENPQASCCASSCTGAADVKSHSISCSLWLTHYCRLSPQDAAATETYLLHVLPELHGSSSTSAALVLLFCTAASSPSQRLQSAVTLLQHLPIGLAAPHHHTHAPADTTPAGEPTPGQVQLVVQLLQLFTAPAFTESLSNKPRTKAAKASVAVVADGAELLLHLMRFKVEDASDALAGTIRQTAFQQLTAELYAQLPLQPQMKAFLVSTVLISSCCEYTTCSVSALWRRPSDQSFCCCTIDTFS